MPATREPSRALDLLGEPAGEQTQVRRIAGARTIAVDQLQYHLLVPRRTQDPLLESAYELWRDVWRATFLEAEGVSDICSDEFTRQDEIGVLTSGARCVAVTALRWVDLSTARFREDSYFKPWPAQALDTLDGNIIGISSNAAVHPDWRGTLLAPPVGSPAEPVRLVYISVGLTIQRFFESPAHSSVAVTRNDRRMDRVCRSLGARSLSQIILHGVDADVMHFPRHCVRKSEPALDDLWKRRQQH